MSSDQSRPDFRDARNQKRNTATNLSISFAGPKSIKQRKEREARAKRRLQDRPLTTNKSLTNITETSISVQSQQTDYSVTQQTPSCSNTQRTSSDRLSVAESAPTVRSSDSKLSTPRRISTNLFLWEEILVSLDYGSISPHVKHQ